MRVMSAHCRVAGLVFIIGVVCPVINRVPGLSVTIPAPACCPADIAVLDSVENRASLCVASVIARYLYILYDSIRYVYYAPPLIGGGGGIKRCASDDVCLTGKHIQCQGRIQKFETGRSQLYPLLPSLPCPPLPFSPLRSRPH